MPHGPHFFLSVRHDVTTNILAYGPHSRLIRAYYLSNRAQRVVLNGKSLNGLLYLQEFLKVLYLTSLFLIYINDLVENLSLEAKLFADDTSLFSVVCDENVTAEKL